MAGASTRTGSQSRVVTEQPKTRGGESWQNLAGDERITATQQASVETQISDLSGGRRWGDSPND